jgi:hypothetical protein
MGIAELEPRQQGIWLARGFVRQRPMKRRSATPDRATWTWSSATARVTGLARAAGLGSAPCGWLAAGRSRCRGAQRRWKECEGEDWGCGGSIEHVWPWRQRPRHAIRKGNNQFFALHRATDFKHFSLYFCFQLIEFIISLKWIVVKLGLVTT